MLSLREDVLRVQTAEVQHILKQHMNRAVDKANHQRVNIRRQELLKDAFRQFKRTSFDATKMLRITFLGESAVDGGGPRREFFACSWLTFLRCLACLWGIPVLLLQLIMSYH